VRQPFFGSLHHSFAKGVVVYGPVFALLLALKTKNTLEHVKKALKRRLANTATVISNKNSETVGSQRHRSNTRCHRQYKQVYDTRRLPNTIRAESAKRSRRREQRPRRIRRQQATAARSSSSMLRPKKQKRDLQLLDGRHWEEIAVLLRSLHSTQFVGKIDPVCHSRYVSDASLVTSSSLSLSSKNHQQNHHHRHQPLGSEKARMKRTASVPRAA